MRRDEDSEETDPRVESAVDAEWSWVEQAGPPEAASAGGTQWEESPELGVRDPSEGRKKGARFEHVAARGPRVRPRPPPPAAGRYPKLWQKLTGGEPEASPGPESAAGGEDPVEVRSSEADAACFDEAPTPPPSPRTPPLRSSSAAARRTFFPAPRPLADSGPPPVGSGLDGLLQEMAEGLLIGTSSGGGTQLRLTLNDAYLTGTEVVVEVEGGKVQAVFIPPDRDTYWRIESESDRLRRLLEGRGLQVESVSVRFPPLS